MNANLADRVEGLPARIYAHEFTGETGRGGWTGHNGYGIGTEYIRADLVDDLVKALEESREALSVFAAFSDKAERFVDHKVKFGGTAIFPVKDFRLSHFRRAVEVVALIDTLRPGDAP